MKTDWFKMKTAGVLAIFGLLSSNASAQESKTQVPWENMVNADDTAVFWVLAALAVLLLILIWVVAGVTKGLLSDKELWQGKWGKSAKSIATLIGATSLFASANAFATSAETEVSSAVLFEMSDGLFWIMVIVNVFLVLVLLGMIYNLNNLIKSLRSSKESEAVAEAKSEKSFWEGSLSEAVPIEQEKDILMDHEYDGIMELDNKLPPWWLYMFYGTIIFGLVYIVHFEITPIPGLDQLSILGPVEKGTQEDRYDLEMTEAEEAKAEFLASSANNVDETTATQMTDASALANGKKTFESLCVACHAKSGGSTQNPPGVGPNLTDEYWIHGGGIKNIFKLIKYGNPSKGMISWEAQLSPVQIQEVASYIMSLEGSNPENGKEPQGEIWEEGTEVTPAEADAEVSEEVVETEEIELLKDKASLANGKKVFDAMCVACHGMSGGSNPGGVGPNLTDEFWLKGGGINNIYHTIKVGVPEKGMIAWENTLSEQQMQEVASYIVSLGGTNPADAKEPQGEKWEGN
ncbi:MAG: c-type cytochrome [Flavobacteriales bacterium]